VTGPRSGWRMLFGGSGPEGMDRRFIRRFVELAGGAHDARVAVVPTASEERAETIARYEESFAPEGVRHLEILDVREHEDADLPETVDRLRDATAVMFTGGDQLRLLDVLMGTEFAAELRRRGRDGVVIGGSSAGSMALGDPVILRGEPTAFYEPGAIRHAPGLGLVEGATVDTHLVVRGRLGRLMAMVAAYPDTIGLGIDEDCGLEISPEGVATVMGHGVVCVVDGHGADPAPAVARDGRALSVSGLAVHVLADGDSFDIRARRVRRA
jgi:cyanophycinase